MHSSGLFSFGYLRLGLIAILLTCGACGGSSHHEYIAGKTGAAPVPQTQAVPPLSPDDVSLLFPAPTRVEDFAKLIAVRDLATQNPQDPAKRDPVWPDAVFQQFLGIAASPAAQVAGTQIQIGLPVEVQSKDVWWLC